MLALLRAVRLFDIERGDGWSSYCLTAVQHAMWHHIDLVLGRQPDELPDEVDATVAAPLELPLWARALLSAQEKDVVYARALLSLPWPGVAAHAGVREARACRLWDE